MTPPTAEAAAAALTPGGHRLRLLSYNVQVGINSTRPHHYVLDGWRHVVAHQRRFHTLDRIAELLSGYDVVALQEVDAGSRRTGFVNLTEYLANGASFPFWHHQVNRDLAGIARHSNGLLSRYRPSEITEHKLPGMIPGRGALVARYGSATNPLMVVLLHLALGRRTRLRQLDFVAELVNSYRHVVVMGDLNCAPDSPEMIRLFSRTDLIEPIDQLCTFPSWRPKRNIDHILVTPELEVSSCCALNHALSDHLPIAMEVRLPADLHLTSLGGLSEVAL